MQTLKQRVREGWVTSLSNVSGWKKKLASIERSPRLAPAEERLSESSRARDGTFDVFERSVGIFARLEPLSLGDWLLRKRRGYLLSWQDREVHDSKEAALSAALTYLDDLQESGTGGFDVLDEEAASLMRKGSGA